MNQESKKETIVVVSGGFDPIHPGHIRMFKEAKALGDKLVVILNNDNWLLKKKKFTFMTEQERKEVLEALRWVDEVIVSRHPTNPDDMSVSADLARLKPDIFANGGDRNEKDAQNPNSSLHKDLAICKEYNIKMIFNVGRGGKIQSSSSLVSEAIKAAPRKVDVRISKGKR
jgi:D-beta-D-heptose 7-phosphate kinase/D-beta-D-heptose 1-phosphate adenosyltransferase